MIRIILKFTTKHTLNNNGFQRSLSNNKFNNTRFFLKEILYLNKNV